MVEKVMGGSAPPPPKIGLMIEINDVDRGLGLGWGLISGTEIADWDLYWKFSFGVKDWD